MSDIPMIGSMFKDGKIPPLDMIECNHCSVHNAVVDCEWYMEQDGWEMPEYKVHICPVCGSDDLEYYPSEAYEKKYWEELYGKIKVNK